MPVCMLLMLVGNLTTLALPRILKMSKIRTSAAMTLCCHTLPTAHPFILRSEVSLHVLVVVHDGG